MASGASPPQYSSYVPQMSNSELLAKNTDTDTDSTPYLLGYYLGVPIGSGIGASVFRGGARAAARYASRRAAVATSSRASARGGWGNPLSIVPKRAARRQLTPSSTGGSQVGVEYKWVNKRGQTIRLRAHDADMTAPPGSNSASGATYRISVGGRYADADGNLYPRGVHNPKSPNYDSAAANATHIPWPEGIPLPWE